MLRDFARRDQRAVRDLILDGLRERWGDGFDPSYNADLEDITSSYVAKGAEVVVFDDGTVHGNDEHLVAEMRNIPQNLTQIRQAKHPSLLLR